jgi:integrase
MARQIHRLKPLQVERQKSPGLYSDGGGLYLQVRVREEPDSEPIVARSWIFRYRMNGRTTPRDMGLGSLVHVGLAEARQKAEDARRTIRAGLDPIDSRRTSQATSAAAAAKAKSFEECAASYIKAHSSGWRNERHGAQWTATLQTYAHPVLGKLPVSTIEIGHVMKVLEPIWTAKPETASRVRGRIEAILGWATVRGFRSGDNPAQWRDRLDNLLPSPKKVRKVEHHPALPYDEIGEFMRALRAQGGIAAQAMEFIVLTASRTSEAIGATWTEVDLKAAIWTVPADRIKAGKEHRVPLSPAAVALLRELDKHKIDEFVLRGGKRGRRLSNNALLALLKRMGWTDITTHGFRSTFRDWAAERTNYPREVAEMALAHAVSDKVEAAYRRGDLFEKRRRLMNEWAAFCGKRKAHGGKIITLHRAG